MKFKQGLERENMMGKEETAKENIEKSQSTGFNLALLLGCVVLLVIVIFLLSIHLGSPNDGGVASFFSYSKADLGTLGDLLGGTLNPILSFATICLLVWSIQIQLKELQETRKEMTRSSDALEKTNSMHYENLVAQERNFASPILLENLENKMTELVMVLRQDVSLDVWDQDGQLVGDPSDTPSFLEIADKLERNIEVGNVRLYLARPERKDLFESKINKILERINRCTKVIIQLNRIKTLKELYNDDYEQLVILVIALEIIINKYNLEDTVLSSARSSLEQIEPDCFETIFGDKNSSLNEYKYPYFTYR